MATGVLDVVSLGVQPVDYVALVGREGGREPTVAAAEVYDQPTANAGVVEDLRCQVGGVGTGSTCQTGKRDDQSTGEYGLFGHCVVFPGEERERSIQYQPEAQARDSKVSSLPSRGASKRLSGRWSLACDSG